LMLKADVSGTKYWVDKKLSKLPQRTTSAPVTNSSAGVIVQDEALEPKL